MAKTLVMPSKNKYSKYSKISERKIRQLVKRFLLDLTDYKITKITGVNCNIINRSLTAL